MKVTKLSVTKDIVACHYCDKGELKLNGYGLQYPYDTVIELRGNHISSCFCEECYDKFVKLGAETLNN